MTVISFQQALELSNAYRKRHLLLGNGFSIACDSRIFNYSSLYEQASQTHFRDIPQAARLFEVYRTKDFEVVIHALENAAQVLPVFDPGQQATANEMQRQAEELKIALLRTIADNHPDIPNNIADTRFWSCRQFLSNFIGPEREGKVYTLNYDLLLYWAVIHDDPPSDPPIELIKDDGFGRDESNYDEDYVTWQGETNYQQNIHYLHGAVHLFDAGTELKKYTWINTGIPLLEQAREAMGNGMFPLFVAEGSSSQKLTKIKHNAFLHHSYKSFANQMNQRDQALFIYGHSLAENDQHILSKISKSRLAHVFVSLFGDENSEENRRIKRAAESLAVGRHESTPLTVSFYQAESANVWGDNP